MKSQLCRSLKEHEDGTTSPRIPLGQSVALPHRLTAPLAVHLYKGRATRGAQSSAGGVGCTRILLLWCAHCVWLPPGLSCLASVLPVTPDPRGPTNPSPQWDILGSPEGFSRARIVRLRWRCAQKKRLCEETGCAGRNPRWPSPAALASVHSGDLAAAARESGLVIFPLPTRVPSAVAALWGLDEQGRRGWGRRIP